MGGGVENPYLHNAPDYTGEGMTVDTKGGNDDVYMGEGDDTVYLGESHHTGLDKDAQKEADAQADMEAFMVGDDASILENASWGEDSALKTSEHSDSYIDMAHGGGGNDTIYGEEGIDAIFGGSDNDLLFGGAGNDGIRGGTGNDIIYGDEGNDILDGGAGADKIMGGSGDDLIKFDFQDVFVDGGENSENGDHTDMDVLLTGGANLNRVKEMLEDGEINNVEVLIAGDVEGQNIDAILKNSGAQDDEGNWNVEAEGSGWSENTSSSVPQGYREFSTTNADNENVTILIEATKLEHGV